MIKKYFTWFKIRVIVTSMVAFWGFYLIFKEGFNSGGKTLLIIALISYIVGIIQLGYTNQKNKKLKNS